MDENKVSLALDKNCWVCAKWMLHSARTIAIPAQNWNGDEASPATVECSNHFVHTHQFFIQCQTHSDLNRLRPWLPDGYSRIFRSYVFGPSGF